MVCQLKEVSQISLGCFGRNSNTIVQMVCSQLEQLFDRLDKDDFFKTAFDFRPLVALGVCQFIGIRTKVLVQRGEQNSIALRRVDELCQFLQEVQLLLGVISGCVFKNLTELIYDNQEEFA